MIVPYKGSSAVITALRSGEIDAGFEILGPTLSQIGSRAVRALAVTGDQRNLALPDVQTANQSGVTGYDVESWNALAAPAGTPQEKIARLSRAADEAIALPNVKKRLRELGARPQAGTPARLETLLAGEIKRWREVIVAAKIEPE